MNVIDTISAFIIRLTGRKGFEYILYIAVLAFFFPFVFSIIFVLLNIPGFLFTGNIREGGLILLMMEISLLSLGISLPAEYILKRYDRSHCAKCNRDLACDMTGEREVFTGGNKEPEKIAVISYTCRFCGDISYKK